MTTYHHGNLRAALVDAAVAAARADGPDGLVLRSLAKRVGVSHNAAYRHFADRDALVAEVAEVGLRELTASGVRRLATVDADEPVLQARRRLYELGRSYVDFALAEPGLFRVVFQAFPQIGSIDDPHAFAQDSDPLGQLNACLDDLVSVGFLDPAARPGAELSCWSAVHGFSALNLDGPLRLLPDEMRDDALDVMLLMIDRGYGATTGTWPPLATPPGP